MLRAQVVVRGRVQGVSFRWSARHEAARLGLTGWVRNELDGDVRLEAQGDREAVDAMLAWCRRGPPGAHVTGIEIEWIEPRPDEARFEIRH